jgi:hypothetical protein
MTQPLPWSHSSLEAVATCPRQYEEIKVLRNFQDQKNEASLWGDYFHKEAERYIRDGGNLPENMLPHMPYLLQFVQRPGTKVFVEQQYGLNVKLQPCEFLGKDVWCRGIVDVLTLSGAGFTVANIDDHKTGKNRKKDMQQLIIFALLTFYHHPTVNTAHCAYHWVGLGGAKDTETFYRHQIPELWATLIPKLQRYKKYFDVGVFPAKPSGLCRKHCAVNTCEYWGGTKR